MKGNCECCFSRSGRQFFSVEEILFSAHHASYEECLGAGTHCFLMAIDVRILAGRRKEGEGGRVREGEEGREGEGGGGREPGGRGREGEGGRSVWGRRVP